MAGEGRPTLIKSVREGAEHMLRGETMVVAWHRKPRVFGGVVLENVVEVGKLRDALRQGDQATLGRHRNSPEVEFTLTAPHATLDDFPLGHFVSASEVWFGIVVPIRERARRP